MEEEQEEQEEGSLDYTSCQHFVWDLGFVCFIEKNQYPLGVAITTPVCGEG